MEDVKDIKVVYQQHAYLSINIDGQVTVISQDSKHNENIVRSYVYGCIVKQDMVV